MILCVGMMGSGKSVLLRHLQSYDTAVENQPPASKKPLIIDEEEMRAKEIRSIPTMGTNLVTIAK